MSINIDMPAQEIAALKQITQVDNEADAIVRAAREFLRLTRLRELKAASGKVELNGDTDWQKLEELELGESSFPL